MKARVFRTEAQIRRIVQDEATKQTTQIYEKAMKDAVYQNMAVVFCVLHREYGFGGERLRKLKNSVEAEYMAMKLGVLGKKYDTDDCRDFLKEKYGIDFEESMYGENWDRELRK